MGSDNEKVQEKDKAVSVAPFVIFQTVPPAVGLTVATVVYKFGSYSLPSNGWPYLSLFVLGRTISVVNMLPMLWKQQIMDKGNIRSNPFIYGEEGKYVTFVEEGNVGKYNRANRSLHHMIENFGVVVAGIYATSQVFPFPTFVLTVIFGIGRILHSIGYTKGYGTHAPGFMLATIATASIEGMCLFVALKALF